MTEASPTRSLDTELLRSWQALSQQADDDFLQEVLSIFLETTPATVTDMVREVKTGNLETLGRLAHKLRGSAANLGAVRLAELCGEIETLAHQPDSTEAIAAHVDCLQAEFAIVKKLLQTDYLKN